VPRRVAIAVLEPPVWRPPGVDPEAWRMALAEDVLDVLALMSEVDPAIAVAAGEEPLLKELGWPGLRSYVLEGRIGARVGDDEFVAEAGSYILKPRKIPHVFWNPDDRPARILEIITPSGLEEMFARFGALGARGELTPETMGATAADYGSTMFFEWVPELVERYGLTLLG